MFVRYNCEAREAGCRRDCPRKVLGTIFFFLENAPPARSDRERKKNRKARLRAAAYTFFLSSVCLQIRLSVITGYFRYVYVYTARVMYATDDSTHTL